MGEFCIKNSNIQMLAHSKELVVLSRMTPKSTRSNKIEQSYDRLF